MELGKTFTAILITVAAIVAGKKVRWVVITGEELSLPYPAPLFLVTPAPYHRSFSPPSALLSPHHPSPLLPSLRLTISTVATFRKR